MDLNENKINKIKIGKIKDLSGTNLRRVDLSNADLRGVNLSNADLSEADLRYANLRYADLKRADLRGADLKYADLRYADLRYADLKKSNLRYANLRYADLRYANLSDIKYNFGTEGYNMACPEKGSFIGYKKANDCIIELLIPEDSKRSSATTMKCRCDKAKVLDITNIKTGEKINSVASEFDKDFIYTVGEIVRVDDFDEDRWYECTTGIHFFMNKEKCY